MNGTVGRLTDRWCQFNLKEVLMNMRQVFVILLVLIVGISTVFASGQAEEEEAQAAQRPLEIELRDPAEFQAEILAQSGVPFAIHDEFSKAVSVPSEPLQIELDQPIRIGFATPSFDISDAWARWYYGMYFRLQEAGIPFTTNMQATGAHDAHAEQLAQVEALIAAGVDYMVIGPTQLEAARVAIEVSIAAGIPTLVINYARPLEGEEDVLMYSGFDHEYGGYLNGVHMAETSGGTGTIAGLRLVPGPLDDLRWGGAMAVLEQTDVELVYDTYAQADRQKGYDATVDILTRYPDLDMIYATSSSMALGAASAAETLGVELDIWGFGGTVEEVEFMQEGLMTGSVFRFQDDGGAAIAEAIKRHLEGREDEIPRTFMGDMVIAHSGMSKAEFRALLERAHRYSKEEMGVD